MEVISKELLEEITKEKIIFIGGSIENEISYRNTKNKNDTFVNIHELAHEILDYAVNKKYVARLTKVKEFWYCEYDTEEHYKYNGTMRKGLEDTKSDNPLKSASIMGQCILNNKDNK